MSSDVKSQHAEWPSSSLSSPGQVPKTDTLDFATINFRKFLSQYRKLSRVREVASLGSPPPAGALPSSTYPQLGQGLT